MPTPNCSYVTPAGLDRLETLSGDDLAAWIRDCLAICEKIAGTGNPDLFGIGVSESPFLFPIVVHTLRPRY